jgi:hypothetical protein
MQFYLAINGKPWSKDNPEPWVTENPMSLMTRESVVGQIYDSAWVHAPRHVLFIDTDAGTVKDVVHEIAVEVRDLFYKRRVDAGDLADWFEGLGISYEGEEA